jgi:cation transport regulator
MLSRRDNGKSLGIIFRSYRPVAFRRDSFVRAQGCPMPYQFNSDLPLPVRSHLPEGAQDIYRAAFNSAFESHSGDPRQEEIAHRVAWAAVKRSYVKRGEIWVRRQGGDN